MRSTAAATSSSRSALGEDLRQGELLDDQPVQGQHEQLDGHGVAGEAGGLVVRDVGIDVRADPLGEDLAQLGTARGLEAQFEQGEVSGAEPGDAADELPHQHHVGLPVAAGRPLAGDRRVVGLEPLVDAGAGLGEEVVPVGEVVGRGPRRHGRLGVHRPERQSPRTVPGQYLDRRVDERGTPLVVPSHH
jgi:hypothetical protein